jgi:hypothetical protein
LLPVQSSQIIRSKIPLGGFEKLIGSATDIFFKRNYALSKGENVTVLDNFDDDTALFFKQFAASFPVSRTRNKEYLQWRYTDRPGTKHFIAVLRKENTIAASGVFKWDKIFGVDALLLLDFAFAEEKDLASLIHYIRKNSKEIFNAQPGLIFTAFCCSRFLKNKTYGFIKVPERMNPRAVKLLVKNISEDESLVTNHSNWFATLGDWDVF